MDKGFMAGIEHIEIYAARMRRPAAHSSTVGQARGYAQLGNYDLPSRQPSARTIAWRYQ